jgi:hypothetical protein
MVLSIKLLHGAQALRETVEKAENWISNAELHAQRIPRVKDNYETIEHQMQLPVARERGTVDSLTRGQLSVEVSQGDVAGGQTDIEVDQIWDVTIGYEGSDLHKTFTRWNGIAGLRNFKGAEQVLPL